MDDALKMLYEQLMKKIDHLQDSFDALREKLTNAVTRHDEIERQVDMLGARLVVLETRQPVKHPGVAGHLKDWKVLGIIAAVVISIGGTVVNGISDPEKDAGDTLADVLRQFQQLQQLAIPQPTQGASSADLSESKHITPGE